MIRINLLPQKQKGRRGAVAGAGADVGSSDLPSQIWLASLFGVVLLEVLVLLFVYKAKQDDFTKVAKKNTEISTNIDNVKREIAKHTEIKNQLKELRDREEAIGKLQSARTGPTATMLELSHILTAGRGPSVERDKLEQLKRDNPGAVPNTSWDPRRLWLSSCKETDRLVRLGGYARDTEDVSEFLKRLSLSDYFYEVKPLPASKGIDTVTKLEMVKFELSAKVRY